MFESWWGHHFFMDIKMKIKTFLLFAIPVFAICWIVLFATTAFALREYIEDPALQVHEPTDKLEFKHDEIKRVRGKDDTFEAYWEINGPYVNNENVWMRRMKFWVDCSPENFPDSNPTHVALSTIALGSREGHMIKIYLVPPGTEEFMDWQEVSFIKQEDVTRICNFKE